MVKARDALQDLVHEKNAEIDELKKQLDEVRSRGLRRFFSRKRF
jgi:bacterioferritin (cytochrome b1)